MPNETYLDPNDQAIQQDQGPDMTTMYPEGRPQPNFQDPNQVQPELDTERGYRPQLVSQQSELPEGVANLEQFDLPDSVANLERVESQPEESAPKEEDKKAAASFMKKLDMINTGVHRGVTHFTFKLLGNIPNKKWQAAVKRADKKVEAEYQGDIAKYGGFYPKAGEAAGEMLATLPIMGPYGKVLQGAKYAGKLAPLGLKTLAKYGVAGAGGAGLFAAAESQRYNPEKPGQLLNTEAAKETLKSPASYLAPMAGAKLASWAGKAQQLEEARKIFPQVLPRDLATPGVPRRASQAIFDAFPPITGLGKRTQQLEGIGDDVGQLISKMSGSPEAMNSKDLTKYAGAALQKSLRSLQQGQTELWNKGFKQVPIKNPSAVKASVQESIGILRDSGIPLTSSSANMIEKQLLKKSLRVEDVKNIQGILGDTVSTINRGEYGGIGNRITKELNRVRKDMFQPIEGSLSGSQLAEFNAAREYSSRLFKLQDSIPKVQAALTDEIAARKLIKDMISPVEKFDKAALMGVAGKEAQGYIKAAKLATALEDSSISGKLNLTRFLNKTSEQTDMPEVLGSSYKALQGLNKYVQIVDQANRSKTLGKTLIAGATGVGAAGYALNSDKLDTADKLALVSYPAALLAANHPALKNLFIGMTKKLSPSATEHLVNKASNLISRYGYFMNNDRGGNPVLEHKDRELIDSQE